MGEIAHTTHSNVCSYGRNWQKCFVVCDSISYDILYQKIGMRNGGGDERGRGERERGEGGKERKQ